jgi:hypothetical protein
MKSLRPDQETKLKDIAECKSVEERLASLERLVAHLLNASSEHEASVCNLKKRFEFWDSGQGFTKIKRRLETIEYRLSHKAASRDTVLAAKAAAKTAPNSAIGGSP